MFSCTYCNRQFSTYPALNAHQIIHKDGNEDGVVRTASKSNEKVVCCVFTRKELSIRTFESQLKNIKRCENCDNEFKQLYGARFCSKSCARTISNSKRGKRSDKTKTRISNSLTRDVILDSNTSYTHKRRLFKRSIVGEYSSVCINKCNYCNILFVGTKPSKSCKNHSDLYYHKRKKYNFTFNIFDYPDIFDLKEIEKRGFYNPRRKDNSNFDNGLSRDHKVSVNEAIKNSYDPFYIKHPLNCQLISQRENIKKKARSSISYRELVEIVDEYEKNMAPDRRNARRKDVS